MTIEAGVLSLRIAETGADQVLSKLDQIDKKAMALGKAVFNQPSSTGVNGQLQQLSANFTAVGQAAATSAPALEKQAVAQAKIAQTAAAVGAQSSGLAKAASGFASVAAGLGALGIAISAGTILANLVGLVRDAIDAGDALHDLAMRTGVSVESLSVLGQVAAKSGADTGVLTVGFRNLSKEVEKARGGNKEAVAAFAALGLSVKDFAGLSLDQIFVKVADAQDKFADGAGKTAAMVQIFGRAGDQLIPTLHELANGGFDAARARAEELGGVISDQFANRADTFNDQLEDLHTALRGLGMVIADPLLPFLTRMADLFTTLIVKAQGFGSAVENMLIRTPLGPLVGLLNAALPTKFTRMGPTLEQLNSGRDKPDVPTIVKASAANDREAAAIAAAIQARERLGLVRDPLIATGDGSAEARMVGLRPADKLKGDTAAQKLVEKTLGSDKAIAEAVAKKKEFINGLLTDAGMIVGGAFGSAFTAAFQEGGNFFEAFGKSLLSGLGNIIMQLGEQMIAYAAIITPLTGVLGPFAGIAGGGPMTLAAGIALTALGAAMGAAGGGGKGGKGSSGSTSHGSGQGQQDNTFALAFDPDRKLRKGKAGSVVGPNVRGLDSSAMPEGRQPIVFAPTIIGADHKPTQRTIAKMVEQVVKDGGVPAIKRAS